MNNQKKHSISGSASPATAAAPFRFPVPDKAQDGLFPLKNKTCDPRWQRKRLEIFKRDGFACQRCYDDSKQIEVHHLAYLPGVKSHDHPDEFLITLCRDCHQHETENIQEALSLLVHNVRTSGLLSDEIKKLADTKKRRVSL